MEQVGHRHELGAVGPQPQRRRAGLSLNRPLGGAQVATGAGVTSDRAVRALTPPRRSPGGCRSTRTSRRQLRERGFVRRRPRGLDHVGGSKSSPRAARSAACCSAIPRPHPAGRRDPRSGAGTAARSSGRRARPAPPYGGCPGAARRSGWARSDPLRGDRSRSSSPLLVACAANRSGEEVDHTHDHPQDRADPQPHHLPAGRRTGT